MKYINLISYVKRSEHRTKVLKNLEKEIKFPRDIFNQTRLQRSDVSRALKELKSKKLVHCLNENEKQGRLYEITGLGKKVLNNLDSL
ncbi:MAG: MarR family transcriptional regulator [Methanobrevibacter sp.]|nr:MarR family transcriptional regulator [Candidatus Methanoflexus mossambicus]